MRYKCHRCGKSIPGINVEFGGGSHYWSPDSDLYCSKNCYDAIWDDMARDFAPGGPLSTPKLCEAYLLGKDPFPYE